MEAREDRAWLLRNRFDPFPVSGVLALSEAGISFVLDADSADASLGWLEDALGSADLKQRLLSGEDITAFATPLTDCEVTWPLTGGGSMMAVTTQARRWIVSHDYPTGGAILQTLNVMAGRGKAKAWKKALASAEAQREKG